ncbi:MAG: ATP-binding protein [bacterium]
MKIVILGSHGTGKTTIAQELHKYLREKYTTRVGGVLVDGINNPDKTVLAKTISGQHLRWKYLPDGPIEALQKGFPVNDITSVESEWWIIAKQIELELLTPQPWVADKCLIDILAYAHFLFQHEPEFLRVAGEMIKKNINYDLVIYLPTGEFPIEDNGMRSTDPKFQKDIDDVILDLLMELNIPYYRISGDKKTRSREVRNILDKTINLI